MQKTPHLSGVFCLLNNGQSVCKPSSVEDDHLSSHAVADMVKRIKAVYSSKQLR